MGIKVDNQFVVPAPVDEAWATLLDMPRVVPCMPGTGFSEAIDERRFKATARIKVGPVELQFRGEGEVVEADAAARRARLKARGNDAKGRGTFQTDMTFSLTPEGDHTQVRVETDLTLSGSVAQYGRGAGLIREITQQLTGQFAVNLAALFEADRVVRAAARGDAHEHAPAQVPEPPVPPASAVTRDPLPPGPQVVLPDLAPPATPPSVAPGRVPSDATVADEAPAPRTDPAAPGSRATAAAGAGPAVTPAALSGTSLLWSALKAMVLRWLGRKA